MNPTQRRTILAIGSVASLALIVTIVVFYLSGVSDSPDGLSGRSGIRVPLAPTETEQQIAEDSISTGNDVTHEESGRTTDSKEAQKEFQAIQQRAEEELSPILNQFRDIETKNSKVVCDRTSAEDGSHSTAVLVAQPSRAQKDLLLKELSNYVENGSNSERSLRSELARKTMDDFLAYPKAIRLILAVTHSERGGTIFVGFFATEAEATPAEGGGN